MRCTNSSQKVINIGDALHIYMRTVVHVIICSLASQFFLFHILASDLTDFRVQAIESLMQYA